MNNVRAMNWREKTADVQLQIDKAKAADQAAVTLGYKQLLWDSKSPNRPRTILFLLQMGVTKKQGRENGSLRFQHLHPGARGEGMLWLSFTTKGCTF